MNADQLRVWIARLAAPLAFFFAATVLVILVQRALESDPSTAGTTDTSTEQVDTAPEGTTAETTTTTVPKGCRRARYVVKSGDTLESISAKCDVPLSDLIELNPNIDPLTLNPGDRVRIKPRQNQDQN